MSVVGVFWVHTLPYWAFSHTCLRTFDQEMTGAFVEHFLTIPGNPRGCLFRCWSTPGLLICDGLTYHVIIWSCAQVESALQVQKLKPTIDAIKAQYGDDKKAIQRETTALYEASGVNPAAGAQSKRELRAIVREQTAGVRLLWRAQSTPQPRL